MTRSLLGSINTDFLLILTFVLVLLCVILFNMIVTDI